MDDKINILYDHYKETYLLSKQVQEKRNKHFIMLCILETLSFLLLIRPEKALEILLLGINQELNASLELSNTILQTLLWILNAYITIRYVQDCMYIEREYKYIERIEKKISKAIDGISREGVAYQENYPAVLNIIDLFYKMVLPVMFIIINTCRIVSECWSGKVVSIALLCDIILFLVIFIVLWTFFFEIHPCISKWIKTNIPWVRWIVDKINQLLKLV